jgi:superoxide dismutase, Fe-Mn family
MKMNILKAASLLTFAMILTVSCAQQSSDRAVYTFDPLPYPYDALERSIDAQTMEIHYDRHHRAYYNNFVNAVKDSEIDGLSLEEIFARMSTLPTGVRNNAGGHYNHSLFWNIMSPDGGGQPQGNLASAINETFGSFDEFKKEFEAAGATRFGSGWAWLAVDANGKLFVSSTANQDNPLMDVVDERGTPILGLDVWEHAYYLKYQNKRTSYMAAFWDVVDWNAVADRYKAAIN